MKTQINEIKRMQHLAGILKEETEYENPLDKLNRMTYDSEDYFNQEMLFDFEGNTYDWTGDYRVEFYNEKTKIKDIIIVIKRTKDLVNIDDYNTQVKPTPAMLAALKAELEADYIS